VHATNVFRGEDGAQNLAPRIFRTVPGRAGVRVLAAAVLGVAVGARLPVSAGG